MPLALSKEPSLWVMWPVTVAVKSGPLPPTVSILLIHAGVRQAGLVRSRGFAGLGTPHPFREDGREAALR